MESRNYLKHGNTEKEHGNVSSRPHYEIAQRKDGTDPRFNNDFRNMPGRLPVAGKWMLRWKRPAFYVLAKGN
jgi:hypothetical protein